MRLERRASTSLAALIVAPLGAIAFTLAISALLVLLTDLFLVYEIPLQLSLMVTRLSA